MFERPSGYHIRAYIASYLDLDESIFQRTWEGDFNDVLQFCDGKAIRDCFERESRESLYHARDYLKEPIRCDDVRLKSNRTYVVDHLKDVLAQRWPGVKYGRWTSVMLETGLTFNLWMIPSEKIKVESIVRTCCEAMFDLLEFMKVERLANAQICELHEEEAILLLRYDRLLESSPHRRPDQADMQSLLNEARRQGNWIDKCDDHPFWRGCKSVIEGEW